MLTESSAIIRESEKLFKDSRTVKAVESIAKAVESGERSEFRIAWTLLQVNDKDLYTIEGYKSIVDFSEQVLGMKKGNTYMLMRIAKICMKSGRVISDFQEYSLNQLDCIYRLSESKDADGIRKAIKDNSIKPSMSCMDIRAKGAKGKAASKKAAAKKPAKPEPVNADRAEQIKCLFKALDEIRNAKFTPAEKQAYQAAVKMAQELLTPAITVANK